MYTAALEAGPGENTHAHRTFEMAQRQVLQFEEQFSAQPLHSRCADFYHALEYVAGAAKALQPEADRTPAWSPSKLGA